MESKNQFNSIEIIINMKKDVYYISDNANWVIKEIGESLRREFNSPSFKIVTKSSGVFSGIKHYSTRYDINKILFWSPLIKNVLTYFHGDDSDIKLLKKIKRKQFLIDVIHTSCQYTKDHLIKHGIKEEKIVIVPIGIEINDFSPVSTEEKKQIKSQLGIPLDKKVIGSFQKDGNGWGEGNEPKLCKGPDLFCDSVEEIAKKEDVFVLLTGPSRGYVKNRLEKANIPYKHVYLENYKDIKKCFNALDLYIVSSRLEGGPRAPMECQASGVPIISTDVGQVPDMIQDGKNGFITKIGDTETVVKKAIEIFENTTLREELISNGLESVKKFDYSVISDQYKEKIYDKLS